MVASVDMAFAPTWKAFVRIVPWRREAGPHAAMRNGRTRPMKLRDTAREDHLRTDGIDTRVWSPACLLRPQTQTLTDFLFLAFLLLFLRWVSLPIWVVSRQRVTADPPIEVFDPEAEEAPEQVRSSISAVIPKLDQIGFVVVGHLRRDNPGLRGQSLP